MKYLMTLFLLLTVVIPAYSQLTQDDLNQIRLIIKEEIKASETRMKDEIKASETRVKEYVDLKIDPLVKNMNAQFEHIDKRITDARNIIYALIALIIAAIGIPAWRNKKDDRAIEKQMETLIQRIEALENGRIQSS